MKETVETSPPRNTVKSGPVFVKATRAELIGMEDGYKYFYASTDPDHPQYVEKFLRGDPVGSDATGYAQVDPWKVCKKSEMKGPLGRTRDDQGKGADDNVMHGKNILIKTTEENYAAYEAYKGMRSKILEGSAAGALNDTKTFRGETGGSATVNHGKR